MNPDEERTRRSLAVTPAGLAGTLLLLAVVALCIRLGVWQLSRLEERRARNAEVAARLESAPVSDIAQLGDTAGLFYRAATLRGTYDSDRSIVLPGRSHRGVPGVHLLTPLFAAGRGEAVLVNRGWVPSPDAATIDVGDFAIHDTVTVEGLLLPFPGGSESLAQRPRPADDAAGFQRVWFTVDEARLRAQFPYPLLPVTLQAIPGAAPAQAGRAQYPARLDPPPLDEGPHLGYALQWFGFALIGVIGWVALVLRGRSPRRTVPPVAGLLVLCAPATAGAQLRPLDPMEWRVFDDNTTWLIAGVGAGMLREQPASLAGTRGTLLEAGTYTVTLRSGRMAVSLGGTAIWRMTDEVQERPPHGVSRPADGQPRWDAGRAQAATLFRISPNGFPADVVVRFGTTLPTTSDESGLERDRTDFFALAGIRYRRDRLALAMENGVGIHGTVLSDYPQSDAWTYSFHASWRAAAGTTLLLGIVGQEDGLRGHVRGNEDLRELRAGIDIGTRRWIHVRYIRGLRDHSPAEGLRVAAGVLLGGS